MSAHALERLQERVGCSASKARKLAAKAWASTEPVPPEDMEHSRKYPKARQELRFFMGKVYVFTAGEGRPPLLVTVMPSLVDMRKNIVARRRYALARVDKLARQGWARYV